MSGKIGVIPTNWKMWVAVRNETQLQVGKKNKFYYLAGKRLIHFGTGRHSQTSWEKHFDERSEQVKCFQ